MDVFRISGAGHGALRGTCEWRGVMLIPTQSRVRWGAGRESSRPQSAESVETSPVVEWLRVGPCWEFCGPCGLSVTRVRKGHCRQRVGSWMCWFQKCCWEIFSRLWFLLLCENLLRLRSRPRSTPADHVALLQTTWHSCRPCGTPAGHVALLQGTYHPAGHVTLLQGTWPGLGSLHSSPLVSARLL